MWVTPSRVSYSQVLTSRASTPASTSPGSTGWIADLAARELTELQELSPGASSTPLLKSLVVQTTAPPPA
ncbi:hypothetical protein DJ74_04420 [Halorubrum sp. Ea8]|nr:hypothetical protein DJ74_04420 [Halorubrum sp. Ea8]